MQMFVRRKQYILIVGTLLVCLFFSHVRASATINFDIYLSSLSSAFLQEKSLSVNAIVTNYCSTVFSQGSFQKNNFAYYPDQSSFLYLLCSKFKSSSQLHSNYFKRSTFNQLGLTDIYSDIQIDYCANFSNDCNIARIIPKLFNDIMTDYVNMKQANIYGLTAKIEGDETSVEEQVNVFGSDYFDIALCSSEQQSYPKTCRTMKSYIKNANNLLSDVQIFDVDVLLTDSATSTVSCNDPLSSDIFYCGLFGDGGASLVSFVHLAYNELFYYRLFMAYYLLSLERQPGILMGNIYQTNYDKIAKKFSNEYARSMSALSVTFRMLSDSYVAFPFHIGFLMYQEDADRFGVSLAGIATPIYTLYDKLRNVQPTD